MPIHHTIIGDIPLLDEEEEDGVGIKQKVSHGNSAFFAWLMREDEELMIIIMAALQLMEPQ